MLTYQQMYFLAREMQRRGISDNDIGSVLSRVQAEIIKDKTYRNIDKILTLLNEPAKGIK